MIGGEQPELRHRFLWHWTSYGLLSVLVLSSSCRGINPAFREDRGASTRPDAGEVPSGQGKTTSEGGLRSTAGNTTQTSSPPGQSESQTSTPQGQSESSSKSTVPFSSGESVSSSGDTSSAASICDADAAYCFAMNYDEANKVYPENAGKGLSLEPSDPAQVGNGADTGPDASDFKNFLLFNKQGLVRSVANFPRGADGAYGIDVVVRGVGCSDQTRCSLALVGSLGLELNVRDKTIECVGYDESWKSDGRAVMALDFDAASTVGCFAWDHRLNLYVNGELAPSTDVYQLPTDHEIKVEIGVLTSKDMPGTLIADIGRFQYWQDSEKFNRAMQARKSQP